MSDKTRRVNNAGRTSEPVVKRAKPFGKDDKAARESQRRASAYGRAGATHEADRLRRQRLLRRVQC